MKNVKDINNEPVIGKRTVPPSQILHGSGSSYILPDDAVKASFVFSINIHSPEPATIAIIELQTRYVERVAVKVYESIDNPTEVDRMVSLCSIKFPNKIILSQLFAFKT